MFHGHRVVPEQKFSLIACTWPIGSSESRKCFALNPRREAGKMFSLRVAVAVVQGRSVPKINSIGSRVLPQSTRVTDGRAYVNDRIGRLIEVTAENVQIR